MSTNTERMRLCRGAKYPSIEAVKDAEALGYIVEEGIQSCEV